MNEKLLEETEVRQNPVSTRYQLVFHKLILDRFRYIKKFAEEMGVSRSYVSQIVHGFREPTDAEKIRFAKALGVDSRTIFPEDENETGVKNLTKRNGTRQETEKTSRGTEE